MPAPLDDIRVLDLSIGPVGGTATMILGDFGAEVVKVEPPGGDPFRWLANAPAWLRGKRSVEFDLALEPARGAVRELAAGADVLVTTLPPERAQEFGCGYEELAALNPRLVYCRISGFGSHGPYARYPGYEGLAAAKSGRMQAFAGLPDREGPAYAAVQVASHACSQSVVAGVIAALFERESSGRGQLVETSLLRALLPYDLSGALRTQLVRRRPELFENDPMLALGRTPTLNYHPLQAGDGRWMQMGNLLQHLFDNYVSAVELDDIFGDPRYEGSPATWDAGVREAFRDRMFLRMQERTAAEWMKTFVEHGGVAATEYRSTQAALDDPDLVLNGHVGEHQHPVLGRVRQLGPVARLTATPGAIGGPAPVVGEHNDAIPSWPKRSVSPAAPGVSDRPPLAGVTVVEFATVIAAPLGVSLLGDMGARIIKVEPIGGDPYRGMGVLGVAAARTNQGKESIALDLKSPAAQEAVHRILARADMVIHNYRPGVPERLGIGYADCKRLRPEMVYVSVNGYGPLGPGAHRPSTHPIPGAAVGGALMQVGAGRPPERCGDLQEMRAATEKLMRANEANPDPNTSVVVASAAMLGLYAARRFGLGQEVFVDMLGANAYANGDDFISYEGKPPRPMPDHDLLGLCATYRLYQAKSGWVFLALVTDRDFARFCGLTDNEPLAEDRRFADRAARAAHDQELAGALATILGGRTADEWESALAPQGVGCVRADGPLPGEFWLDDAHARENGLISEARHARYGDYFRWGSLVQFARSPQPLGPAVLAGQHTDALLEECGYSAAEIAALRASGVAWSEAVNAV